MSMNHTSQYAQLTDAHFLAIGKLVVEWTNVEFLSRILLTRLLLTPDFPGRTFTDRLAAARVQELIDEAIGLHRQRYEEKIISDQVLREIRKLNKRITTVRVKRNKFAHFCWARMNDDEIFGTNFAGGVMNKKKEEKSSIVLNITEINHLATECYQLVDQLEEVVRKLPEMEEDGIKAKLTTK